MKKGRGIQDKTFSFFKEKKCTVSASLAIRKICRVVTYKNLSISYSTKELEVSTGEQMHIFCLEKNSDSAK